MNLTVNTVGRNTIFFPCSCFKEEGFTECGKTIDSYIIEFIRDGSRCSIASKKGCKCEGKVYFHFNTGCDKDSEIKLKIGRYHIRLLNEKKECICSTHIFVQKSSYPSKIIKKCCE